MKREAPIRTKTKVQGVIECSDSLHHWPNPFIEKPMTPSQQNFLDCFGLACQKAAEVERLKANMHPLEQIVQHYREHSETELDRLKRENAGLQERIAFLERKLKLRDSTIRYLNSFYQREITKHFSAKLVALDWLVRLGDRIVICSEILTGIAEEKKMIKVLFCFNLYDEIKKKEVYLEKFMSIPALLPIGANILTTEGCVDFEVESYFFNEGDSFISCWLSHDLKFNQESTIEGWEEEFIHYGWSHNATPKESTE